MDTKERIIELLTATKRVGMDKLIIYLKIEGFFKSPASTRFHGCYQGGLADHSLGVYDLLVKYPLAINEGTGRGQRPLPITDCTYAIAALLHDVCKVGAYIGESFPYNWNRAQPKGHAKLSIQRIKGFIELTPLEELMIRFHMGVYGLDEFAPGKGEYNLRGDDSLPKEERYGKSMANAWYHNPICKFMYFCDEIETITDKMNK